MHLNERERNSARNRICKFYEWESRGCVKYTAVFIHNGEFQVKLPHSTPLSQNTFSSSFFLFLRDSVMPIIILCRLHFRVHIMYFISIKMFPLSWVCSYFFPMLGNSTRVYRIEYRMFETLCRMHWSEVNVIGTKELIAYMCVNHEKYLYLFNAKLKK